MPPWLEGVSKVMEIALVLLGVLLVNVLAWITPGPNMIAVMSASLTHGRRHGVYTGLGLSTAALLWTLLAVLGVTALFKLFPAVVFWLKLAGAGYLLWLGYRSLQAAFRSGGDGLILQTSAMRGRRAFLTGFLVSATNPKAAFFFGSILTAFVPQGASTGLLAAIVAVCLAVAVAGHSVTATVFSTRLAVALFDRFKRRITAAFGVIFGGLGLAVACDTLRRA